MYFLLCMTCCILVVSSVIAASGEPPTRFLSDRLPLRVIVLFCPFSTILRANIDVEQELLVLGKSKRSSYVRMAMGQGIDQEAIDSTILVGGLPLVRLTCAAFARGRRNIVHVW